MFDAFTDDDEGKEVVDAEGATVGYIEEVDGDTAHVRPDPDLSDRTRTALEWDEVGGPDYPLEATEVEASSDDRIRLPHFG